MLPSFPLVVSHFRSSEDTLLPCSQNGLFSWYPNRQAGRSLLCRSQNQMKSRPIRRRSLLGIRKLQYKMIK